MEKKERNPREKVDTQKIPIEKIQHKSEFKTRGIDREYVDQLAESPDPAMGAIIVDEQFNLVDGAHRIEAEKKRGAKEITSDVYRYSTELEAFVHAIELNARHGRRYSKDEQKRLAIRLQEKSVSVSRIAEYLGVSDRTVSRHTKSIRDESKAELERQVQERGKDGRSQHEIADELGVTRKRVRTAMGPNGQMSEKANIAECGLAECSNTGADTDTANRTDWTSTLRVGNSKVRLKYGIDVLDGLRRLDDCSVHCVVTSPPYWSQRLYPSGRWEGGDQDCKHRADAGVSVTGTPVTATRTCVNCGAMHVDEQIGLEETPELYVKRLVDVFREVRRVLRDDGSLWLNLGDASVGENCSSKGRRLNNPAGEEQLDPKTSPKTLWKGLPPGNLIGLPWKVAFALQEDGWVLRADVIWSKTNPLPHPFKSRPIPSHEHLFILTKGMNYYYDEIACAEPAKKGVNGRDFKLARDVWRFPVCSAREEHDAMMTDELALCAVLSGTSSQGACTVCGVPWKRTAMPTSREAVKSHNPAQWDAGCRCVADTVPCVVLDPFSGSGTTGRAAVHHGRDFIGIDLCSKYEDMAVKRIKAPFMEPPLAKPPQAPSMKKQHNKAERGLFDQA